MRSPFPLVVKIAGAAFLVTLGVLSFVAQVSYRRERAELQAKFGMTLQHIAQTAALFLEGDAHERIRGAADVAGPDFRALRETLSRVRKENDLNEDQIYTLRPVPGGEALEFVVMLQARTFVGDRYAPPQEVREIIRWVLLDGTPRYTPLYRDENGTYVSGYAPIRDRNGRIVALLEVDYTVDRFVEELRKQLQAQVWIVPAALLLSLLLSALVARSITGAVGALLSATAAVRRGHYDHRVVIHTRDELAVLAEAFNDMLIGLRERFAMLKFVPQHTRALIAEAAQGEAQASPEVLARSREVTVLFSDIRGFTQLSNGLPASRVIEMLNIYLRKEAEIIERYGGSIDKFIGDAVMALFEGDDRCERAALAAQEIHAALSALNDAGAFERAIAVGIGVADGEVVMGNIGYEHRMEFAVIGQIVNLSSRLCSIAKGGEIVLSDAVYGRLRPALPATCLEGISLKGFSEPIRCFRLERSLTNAEVRRVPT